MLLRAACVMLVLVALAPLARAADDYKLDPIHSSVIFKIFHNNTAHVYGRFNKIAGTVSIENGDVSAFNATVDVTSVDTNNKDRDKHLNSPDFFDASQFPDITFKSTSVKKLEDGKYEVAGELTLHGNTKPLTVTLTKTGQASNVQKKETLGFETTFTIKRSDWGMNGFINKGVGDEVTLMIGIECAKQ